MNATPLRVAGGLLTVAGAYLPWATFVLNEGPYPAKATLEFFTEPFGVAGYRSHLLLLGVATTVFALVAVPGRARILRALGAGVVAVSILNELWITVEGGGLGAITVSDADVAFGAPVALAGGVLILLAGGARESHVPQWRWRFHPWSERVVLLGVFVLLLMLVSAVLTSGGQGGAANVYAGAVFLSFLAAAGAGMGAVHASGLSSWVAALSERHRGFGVGVLLLCALALPFTGAGTEYWMTVAANIGVYAATAIGLNIVVGLAGLLDLGYVAFLGIGAFVAANLSGAAASTIGWDLPFPLVMVISAVVAGIFSVRFGTREDEKSGRRETVTFRSVGARC